MRTLINTTHDSSLAPVARVAEQESTYTAAASAFLDRSPGKSFSAATIGAPVRLMLEDFDNDKARVPDHYAVTSLASGGTDQATYERFNLCDFVVEGLTSDVEVRIRVGSHRYSHRSRLHAGLSVAEIREAGTRDPQVLLAVTHRDRFSPHTWAEGGRDGQVYRARLQEEFFLVLNPTFSPSALAHLLKDATPRSLVAA